MQIDNYTTVLKQWSCAKRKNSG